MKILLCFAAAIFLVLSQSAFAKLKIGIIGDQTGSENLAASYVVLQEGCQVLNANNPDIVLHIGDIVESSLRNSEIEAAFSQAAGYLNNIRKGGRIVPWYVTAGDHDVNPPGDYTPGTKNKEKENLFLKILKKEYSKRNSWKPDNLYYSFDYDRYHFVCLYSEESLRTDPRWGDIFMNKISDVQFKWLEKDLSAVSSTKETIIFVHHPMWYNWTGWRRVHSLLRKNHVIAVIAGHFHYNQDEECLDGIRYVVVGSTGGNIKRASENAGGIYHVTLMTVSDNKEISLHLIPLKGYSYNRFAERENMDRIQAIDVMLSVINWNPNGVTLKGNPIDIPVDIYLGNHLLHKDVPSGEGIISSNLSNVILKDKGKDEPFPEEMRVQFYNDKKQLFWILLKGRF